MTDDTLDPSVFGVLRSIGDAAFLDEVIGLFNADADARLSRLREAVAAGDAAGVSADGHALKGAAGNIGARRVAALASQLEQQALTGSLEGAADAVELLASAIAEADAALDRERSSGQ